MAESAAASEPRVRDARFGSRIVRAVHAALVAPIAARLVARRRRELQRHELLRLDEHMRADIGVTATDVARLTGRECLHSDEFANGTEAWRWFNDVHFNR